MSGLLGCSLELGVLDESDSLGEVWVLVLESFDGFNEVGLG